MSTDFGAVKGLLNCARLQWRWVCAGVCGFDIVGCLSYILYVFTVHLL